MKKIIFQVLVFTWTPLMYSCQQSTTSKHKSVTPPNLAVVEYGPNNSPHATAVYIKNLSNKPIIAYYLRTAPGLPSTKGNSEIIQPLKKWYLGGDCIYADYSPLCETHITTTITSVKIVK